MAFKRLNGKQPYVRADNSEPQVQNEYTKVSKTWCFTVNNHKEEDVEWVMKLEVNKITVSSEVGESGTPHLQGMVTFKRAYRLAALKKLHSQAHWETAKADQDFNYCKKVGSVLIRNEDWRCPGKRTDIEEVRDLLDSGANLLQAMKKARTYGSVQFAEKYLKLIKEPLPANTRIEVFWYYGNTGTGKTRRVLEQCKPYMPVSHKWWDGYEGQEAVLLDDLRPDWCKPAELLRLLDPYRYEYKVEIKGGVQHLLATKIYITTPWHPVDFWKDTQEDPKQILRRLKELLHFRDNGEVMLKPLV